MTVKYQKNGAVREKKTLSRSARGGTATGGTITYVPVVPTPAVPPYR